MKKIGLLILLLVAAALAFELHGYYRGYQQGERVTNSWWIDKKSLYYDTSEIVKKQITEHQNHI